MILLLCLSIHLILQAMVPPDCGTANLGLLKNALSPASKFSSLEEAVEQIKKSTVKEWIGERFHRAMSRGFNNGKKIATIEYVPKTGRFDENELYSQLVREAQQKGLKDTVIIFLKLAYQNDKGDTVIHITADSLETIKDAVKTPKSETPWMEIYKPHLRLKDASDEELLSSFKFNFKTTIFQNGTIGLNAVMIPSSLRGHGFFTEMAQNQCRIFMGAGLGGFPVKSSVMSFIFARDFLARYKGRLAIEQEGHPDIIANPERANEVFYETLGLIDSETHRHIYNLTLTNQDAPGVQGGPYDEVSHIFGEIIRDGAKAKGMEPLEYLLGVFLDYGRRMEREKPSEGKSALEHASRLFNGERLGDRIFTLNVVGKLPLGPLEMKRDSLLRPEEEFQIMQQL